MGWAIGHDDKWGRFIGYGVPAWCDYPGCTEVIDRGLSYVCCNAQPYGGERGCGLHFCEKHRNWEGMCERCQAWFDDDGQMLEVGPSPFHPKSEHPTWLQHLLTDFSWAEWRLTNQDLVVLYDEQLRQHVTFNQQKER